MAVIALTTFRLADGTDEAAFLAADDRVRTATLYHQPGIVRATTARTDDGRWAVIVMWESAEQADAVDVAVELGDVVDAASVERARYTTLD